jgi:2-polyprenyl-6-methoxyphenol hydroxylase-like FAD-dependent oxidoreductase
VTAGCKATAVNFVASDGKAIGRATMDSVDSPYPYGLMLPQSETERLLEERLARLGVMVERQTEVVRFTVSVSGAEATLRHADGREELVSAAWLAGADGAHSIVRHTVGAEFVGETLDSDWMLADVHMTGYPCPDSEVSVYWHQDGAFVIFPIAPGRYRVLADRPPTDAEHPTAPTLEQVQAVMNRRGPPGLVAFDPIWLAGFRINGRKVGSYRYGRAFLLGDAAHVHSPAGGQGMNTGMQDAFNLAWKLAMAIHNSCADTVLDSYSAERSAVGETVLKTAGRLTTIGTLRNHLAQEIRNIIGHIALGLAPVQQTLANNMTEVSIGYPGSPLNGPALAGGPKPGARVAPVAGQPPVGSGTTPRFALCAAPGATVTQLIQQHTKLLDPLVRPPLPAGGIWLVRPDGYVACASMDGAAIGRYLDRLTPGGAMP